MTEGGYVKLRTHYHTVEDAARLCGVPTWTLRRLETTGRLPKAQRDPISKYRIYDEQAIQNIRSALAQMGDTYECLTA